MEAADRSGITEQQSVLVVEDEPDVAELLRVNLELSGYAVTVAADGAQGLVRAREADPDLVLLDVMMPGLDGWQVLRALKDDPEFTDLPVVMVTALAGERDLIRGHLQGAIHYVTKPFKMSALLDTVTLALKPETPEARDQRRKKVSQLLQRLAELDSGRKGQHQVSFSRLEHDKSPPRVETIEPEPLDPALLDRLTDSQRWLAEQLGRGQAARDLAQQLGVSRSNVYATRKRIARRLGVTPEGVADAVRAMLDLNAEAEA